MTSLTLALLQAAAPAEMLATARNLAYLAAAILFILGIKRLSSPRTARGGNGLAALGMLVAAAATLIDPGQGVIHYGWIVGGLVVGSFVGTLLARTVQMTAMPQMVAVFNGFGGAASALVACAEYYRLEDKASAGAATLVIIGIGTLIGGITLTGSLVAAGKLHGLLAGRPRALPANEAINGVLVLVALGVSVCMGFTPGLAWQIPVIVGAALILGMTLSFPVGGADMPVMVSLLNSYSGLAAAATGFVLDNAALIVSGALVGASGLILTAIMCAAMNRSLANVLFARVGTDDSTGTGGADDGRRAKVMGPDDAALVMDTARKVIIVPGYGLAVAQAQHAVRELMNQLEKLDVEVYFAIHPVAGRMPGHMNVLLAEANIPYDKLLELEPANAECEDADVALVLGANDVVNPAARTEKSSPIYGMPIVDVDKCGTVLVVKRSLGSGYAGVQNPLFFLDNTHMVLGDAKKVLNEIVGELKEL
jgi:NAD(P) transhydrogenase subunit beta